MLRSSPVTPAYDMNHQCSLNFEVLLAPNHRCSINFEDLGFGGGDVGGHLVDLTGNLKWHPLPPPPLFAGDSLVSSALLDAGRTICVSSSMPDGTAGTFCYDTASQEWRRAGDWKLPFYGRGEYVPELQTWVGFTPSHPKYLCSADLAAIAAASRHGPTVQHVWEDFNPPPTVVTARFPGNVVHRTWLEWTVEKLHMALHC
nr:unnamed protein product [Digitaria exilis]